MLSSLQMHFNFLDYCNLWVCKEKNIFKILEWPQDMGTEAPTLVDFNFPGDVKYRFQMCGFVSFKIFLVFVCYNCSP